MDNEKDIEKLIVDYIDGKLSASDREKAEWYIKHHESYGQMEQEYRQLFGAIEEDQVVLPDAKLRDAFQKMLDSETAHISPVEPATVDTSAKVVQLSLKTIYRVAAVLALMLGSYWFGSYTTKNDYLLSLAELEVQKQELKTIAALSLFESESASKRIQAVAFSTELENPDYEILNALIDEMLYDKLVYVRLASARALEQFSENTIVKDAFIAALKTEENATMQIELIEILSHLKERRAIPKMKELLQDEQTPVYIKEELKSELQKLI